MEHNVRSGRDSNIEATEWITAQVFWLFRWPQLYPCTSSRRGPPLETSETPCAARAKARVASQTHARHAPLDRAQGRRARQARTRGHLATMSTRRCERNGYCRESRKFHRQALQQIQGAALNTSKRKIQRARTARQATAVPPPVAPARGARSPRRAARAPCHRSRRTKKTCKKR